MRLLKGRLKGRLLPAQGKSGRSINKSKLSAGRQRVCESPQSLPRELRVELDGNFSEDQTGGIGTLWGGHFLKLNWQYWPSLCGGKGDGKDGQGGRPSLCQWPLGFCLHALK